MATYTTYIDDSTPERLKTDTTTRRRAIGSTPVLLIAAYFLALASIAVIAVGGQFPWFTVAPATVLSLIAYFRHVEAKMERDGSG